MAISSIAQASSSTYHYVKPGINTVLWAISHQKIVTVAVITLKVAASILIPLHVTAALIGTVVSCIGAYARRNNPQEFAEWKKWAFKFKGSAFVPGLPFYLFYKIYRSIQDDPSYQSGQLWEQQFKAEQAIKLEKKANQAKIVEVQEAITALDLGNVADMSLEELNHLPPLVYAHPATLRLILQNPNSAPLFTQDGNILGRLMGVDALAWTEEHHKIVKELLETDPTLLEQRDHEGFTLLAKAAIVNRPLFQALLTAKPDPRCHYAPDGRTLLVLAMERHSLQSPSYELPAILNGITGIEERNAYWLENCPNLYAILERKLELDKNIKNALMRESVSLSQQFVIGNILNALVMNERKVIVRLPIDPTQFPLLAKIVDAAGLKIKMKFTFTPDFINRLPSMDLETLHRIPREIIGNPVILRHVLANPFIVNWTTPEGGNILHQLALLQTYDWDAVRVELITNFINHYRERNFIRQLDLTGNSPLTLSILNDSPCFEILLNYEDAPQNHHHADGTTLITQFAKRDSWRFHGKWIESILAKVPEEDKTNLIHASWEQACRLIETKVVETDPDTLDGSEKILRLSMNLSAIEKTMTKNLTEEISFRTLEETNPLLQQALERVTALCQPISSR